MFDFEKILWFHVGRKNRLVIDKTVTCVQMSIEIVILLNACSENCDSMIVVQKLYRGVVRSKIKSERSRMTLRNKLKNEGLKFRPQSLLCARTRKIWWRFIWKLLIWACVVSKYLICPKFDLTETAAGTLDRPPLTDPTNILQSWLGVIIRRGFVLRPENRVCLNQECFFLPQEAKN